MKVQEVIQTLSKTELEILHIKVSAIENFFIRKVS
jgi:hypothetical protein